MPSLIEVAADYGLYLRGEHVPERTMRVTANIAGALARQLVKRHGDDELGNLTQALIDQALAAERVRLLGRVDPPMDWPVRPHFQFVAREIQRFGYRGIPSVFLEPLATIVRDLEDAAPPRAHRIAWDAMGQCQYMDYSGALALGCASPKELRGADIVKHLTAYWDAQRRADNVRAVQDGAVLHDQVYVLRRPGRRWPASVWLHESPLRDDDGKQVACVGYFRLGE